MFVNFKELSGVMLELNKYDFIELEKQGRAKMLIVTGSDLYNNKNYVATKFGEDWKASEVDKELPGLLENFDKEWAVVGKDIRDGSISYGIMFEIDGKLKNYENGIEYLEKYHKRG